MFHLQSPEKKTSALFPAGYLQYASETGDEKQRGGKEWVHGREQGDAEFKGSLFTKNKGALRVSVIETDSSGVNCSK